MYILHKLSNKVWLTDLNRIRLFRASTSDAFTRRLGFRVGLVVDDALSRSSSSDSEADSLSRLFLIFVVWDLEEAAILIFLAVEGSINGKRAYEMTWRSSKHEHIKNKINKHIKLLLRHLK